MKPESAFSIDVTIGEQAVSIRRRGSDFVTVATILGIDCDDSGKVQRYWLDRLIHEPDETEFVGYRVSGALVTVLEPMEPAT